MRLDLGIMAGAESKQFLVDLTKIVERMEKAAGNLTKTSVSSNADMTSDTLSDDDDDFETDTAPVKKTAKTAAKKTEAFEDDEDETETASTDDDEVSFDEEETEEEAKKKTEPAKATKTAKTPKLTSEDVNLACKTRLKRIIAKRGISATEAANEVKALLKKKFGVTSITKLDPEKYADAIKTLEGK